MEDGLRARLAEALDAIERIVEARGPNPRVRVQPPTLAYARLLLAVGHARIGGVESARGLVDQALAELAPRAGDPIHAYLSAALTTRVEHALAGLPAEAPLPAAIRLRLSELDRISRYKADSFGEASQILEPLHPPSPSSAYPLGLLDVRGREFHALDAVGDDRRRQQAIAHLVDVAAAAADDDQRARLVGGVLGVLVEVDAPEVDRLLAKALPLFSTLPATERARLYPRAIVVADYVHRPDLVGELAAELAALPETAVAFGDAVPCAGPVLHRHGLRRELTALVALVDAARALRPDLVLLDVTVADAAAWLGDLDRALPLLAAAMPAFDAHVGLGYLRDNRRALSRAYGHVPMDVALAAVASWSARLVNVWDPLSTSTHCSVLAFHLVDCLVCCIVQLAEKRTSVDV